MIIILFAHVHWKFRIKFDYMVDGWDSLPEIIQYISCNGIRNRPEWEMRSICTHFPILHLFDAKRIGFGQPQRNDSTIFDGEKGKILLMKNTIHCYCIRFWPHQFHLQVVHNAKVWNWCVPFAIPLLLSGMRQPAFSWMNFSHRHQCIFEFHSVTTLLAFFYVFKWFRDAVYHFQASLIHMLIKCQCGK